MATKFKVKTAAIFDGQPAGSTIELDESLAKYYEALKYVEIIEEVKAPVKKSTSATKKPASKRTTSKSATKSKKTEAKSEDKAENKNEN